MTTLIHQMEQALAQLDAQRTALQAAIQALRGANAASAKAEPTSATKSRQKAQRGRGRASVGTTDATVLDAIKAGHTAPKVLRAKTGLPAYNLSCALKRLIAAKRIQATGSTCQRRYALVNGKSDGSFLGVS